MQSIGMKSIFERNMTTEQVINKNCIKNEPKIVYFQDAIIDLDKSFLVMTGT